MTSRSPILARGAATLLAAGLGLLTASSGLGSPPPQHGVARAVAPGSAGAPPQMPGLGPLGTSTMHGDAGSSDITLNPGPGAGPLAVTTSFKGAACPTVLAGSDGLVVALCTRQIGRAPVALVLDPATGQTLASRPIAKGALLGGVYAYLDDRDRLVLVDGEHRLLRLAHQPTATGRMSLVEDEAVPVADFVTGGGARPDDAVVGLTPDAHGHVWLATREGHVGVLDPATGAVTETALPAGERIDNSISASRQGVAVATSRALYLLDDADGEPSIQWRRAYDHGSGRKPGQLSWGTGATPTFFGPRAADEYVSITDNADDQENLLVLRTADGATVCKVPVFEHGASGTENSAMGYRRSIIVASTYGYPYPALPEGAGSSTPAQAPFTAGGMERWEVDRDGKGCTRAWSSPVLSAAVPRWSVADGLIYTVERPPRRGRTGAEFRALTIDAATGDPVSRTLLPGSVVHDTLQMVGTITPDGVWWQGTLSGVHRVEAP